MHGDADCDFYVAWALRTWVARTGGGSLSVGGIRDWITVCLEHHYDGREIELALARGIELGTIRRNGDDTFTWLGAAARRELLACRREPRLG
jgi:hypothetical protein